MKKDLYNKILQKVAFNTQAISTDTTTNGEIIDLQGFDSATFIIQSGSLTDGTYTPLVHEGNESDLSDAGAVADADLIGTEAAAAFSATDDNKSKRIGYVGGKRYIRLSLVSASTSTGGTLSAVAVLSDADIRPTDAE
jgi:hypothetical protein